MSCHSVQTYYKLHDASGNTIWTGLFPTISLRIFYITKTPFASTLKSILVKRKRSSKYELEVYEITSIDARRMVQLFYYETRGKCCRKVFNYEGYPTKVLLFPYEGWAQPALMSYWLLKTYWWSRSRVKIIEVIGSKKVSTKGKMIDKGNGTMVITGKFKDISIPDFRMVLNTNVSNEDFQQGYCVTGTLERGDKRKGELQLTQYAMVKRKGY